LLLGAYDLFPDADGLRQCGLRFFQAPGQPVHLSKIG
jgi:hypothetical protein